MDRDIILETIQRHLRDNRDASSPARLSELVGRIARDLRREKPESTPVVSVIPIEQVAAFVDGDLDHDRVEAVNRSVLVDNSVLAELVAAVRALQCPTESLPPIAEPLTERLLAVHPIEVVSNKDIARMISEPENQSRQLKKRLAVPLVLSLAGLAWFASTRLDRNANQSETVVVNPSESRPRSSDSSARNEDGVAVAPSLSQDVAPENDAEMVSPMPDTSVVDATVPDPTMAEVSVSESAERDEAVSLPEPKAGTATDVGADKVVREVRRPNDAPEFVDTQPAGGKLPQWKAFAVDRVVGLLGRLTMPANADAVNEVNSIPTYASVRKDDTVSLDSPIGLRSLAFSDVLLNIDSGGQLWMAENTMVVMVGGGDRTSLLLDVIEGSVAIKNVAKGSNIRLRRSEKSLGRIVMSESGHLIVHAVTGGVEVQVQNAKLLVDNDRFDSASVRITPRGVTEVTSPFVVTPAWSTAPSSPVDKAVLNQLADSTDLVQSLDTQIKRLTSSTRLNDSQVADLSKLVQMRVSLAGERLFNLAADPVELVRRTAVETIALLPKNDPRYEMVWTSIEANVSDPVRRGEIDLWMQLIRTGGQPSDEQLATMMQGLHSNNASIRGLGDVMLRRYVGNPPALNPNDSPEKIKSSILRFQQLLDEQ